ncbi:MAG: FecR domain-containing protein [Acidobacteria bacterium]|nr:FecR domain-containing protein [Acidobacteriota bacterium]
MRINGADHSGSANLPAGSKLETLQSAGHLYLPDGGRLRLAAATQLSLQPGNLHLDRGAARVDSIAASKPQLNLKAGELNISTRGATIERPQFSRILVTSAADTTEVRNGAGTLVALVRPGQTLAFSMGSSQSPSAQAKVTGCVTVENGRYFITDEVTNIKTEIEGGQPSKFKGKRVAATGDPAASGPAKISVTEYKELNSKCSLAPAVIGGAGSTPAAGTGSGTTATTATTATAAGLSKSTIILISVASIAAGGASLALVASGEENISQ